MLFHQVFFFLLFPLLVISVCCCQDLIYFYLGWETGSYTGEICRASAPLTANQRVN